MHINSLRSVIQRSQSELLGTLYTTPEGKSFVLSLIVLTKEQVMAIIQSLGQKTKSTAVRAIHIYDTNRTVLLRTFKSVNAFMAYSGRSGRDITNFCTLNRL